MGMVVRMIPVMIPRGALGTEPPRKPGPRALGLHLSVTRIGCSDERAQECLGSRGHGIDGLVERMLVDFRRPLES
jgi:hypothetical protein